jgi:hypothetical protein
MHLLGIKSKTLSADGFFDVCDDYNSGIGEGISIRDCSPSRNHDRASTNEKCSCSAEMFRLGDAKDSKYS